MTTTARYLVDSARSRHWSFAEVAGGDGPAVLFLNSRLRTHLASHGAKIEGLVGSTMSYTLPLSGVTLLVTNAGAQFITNFGLNLAVSGTGLPQLGSAYEDGWPVHVTAGGVPYVDFSEPPIAGDPFGINGGTPGIPLPTDMIRLIAVSAIRINPPGMYAPIDVVPEMSRFSVLPGRNPTAYVSGNRLIPVRPYNTSSANDWDPWTNLTSILISYVPMQTLSSLDDVLNLPAVLSEALIADLCQFFSMQSKACPRADRAAFIEDAEKTAAKVSVGALDLLNEPQQNNVVYNG